MKHYPLLVVLAIIAGILFLPSLAFVWVYGGIGLIVLIESIAQKVNRHV